MAKPTPITPDDAAPRTAPVQDEKVLPRAPALAAELVRFSLGGHVLVVVQGSPTACENGGAAPPLLPCRPSRLAGCIAIGGDTYTIFSLEATDPEEPAAMSRPRSIHFLTQRELQIATLVMQGRVNKQIAHCLHIAPDTVQSHLKHIFCKLGVSSRAAMVAHLAGCLHPIIPPP